MTSLLDIKYGLKQAKVLETATRSKNMKPLWKVIGFEQKIFRPQHRTAQRMRARRSVIDRSLLLLSSLLLSFSLPSFSLLSSLIPFCPLAKKKKTQIISGQEIIMVIYRNSGSFAGPQLCVAGI